MNKIILSTLAVLLMISAVSANSIASESVEIDLEDNIVNLEVEVKELTQNRFNYYVQSYQVEEVISGSINGEEANCYLREEQRLDSQVTCDTELDGNFTVNLELEGSGMVTQQNTASRFQYTQNIHNPTDNYRLRVILPENSGIVNQEDSTEPVIFPSYAEPQTTGQRIYLEWEEDPDISELLTFQILFRENSEPEERYNWQLLIPLGLIILIVVGVSWYLYRDISPDNVDKLKEMLDEDEMFIINQITENNGEILQKDVVNESEHSKAKVSGLVSSLVEKDIITKEKEGRSNKLVLKEKYR